MCGLFLKCYSLIHIVKLFCISYKWSWFLRQLIITNLSRTLRSEPRNIFNTKVGHNYKTLKIPVIEDSFEAGSRALEYLCALQNPGCIILASGINLQLKTGSVFPFISR